MSERQPKVKKSQKLHKNFPKTLQLLNLLEELEELEDFIVGAFEDQKKIWDFWDFVLERRSGFEGERDHPRLLTGT